MQRTCRRKQASGDRRVTIRLPDPILARIRQMAQAISASPAYQGHRMTGADIYRQALTRGLDDLEREHGGRDAADETR